MREVVFIVDDVLESGELVTVTDRIKSISQNFQHNLYEKNKDYYARFLGARVKFARLSEAMAGSLDPSKRYLYFVPIEDWKCHMQIYFNIISREVHEWFAKNDVGIYFAQDFEMYPNLDVNFLGNYLGWLLLCQSAHSIPTIPIYFSMCAELVPHHAGALRQAFGPRVRYVCSPFIMTYTREEIARKMGNVVDISPVMRAYLETKKERMYLSLTRDPKYHRLTMLHGLRSQGLLSDGFVSNLLPSSYDSSSVNSNSEYAERVKFDMPPAAPPMPFMTVDSLSADLIPGIQEGIGGVLPIDHMSASCYDLVQETATNYRHGPMVLDMAVVTEKVVKSLLFGRPFMVNGGPGVLSMLRRWGFGTFPMLFDESYDAHEKFIDRQEILLANVRRWAGKSDEFMSRVKSSVIPVLERNVSRVIQFPLEEVLTAEIDRSEK